MKTLLRFFVFSLIIISFQSFAKSFAGSNNKVTGTWRGKLEVSGVTLRIVFNIKETDKGILSATMESPDQTTQKIPVDSVIFDNGNIKLVIKSIEGYYDGKLNSSDSTISGTWHQRGLSVPLALKKANLIEEARQKEETKPINKAESEAITGNWLGTLNVSSVELRIVFHIKENKDGTLSATMDSPDQGVNGIPVSSINFNNDKIIMDVNSVGGNYNGDLIKDSLIIKGKWSQRGNSLPLILKKNYKPIKYKRPQEPKPPFPYKVENVTFKNNSAGITLAGTLTLPKTGGPFPAVLLIAGSGPHNRDEEILRHKPFLVIADYLTRRGIAVLRYDKRGIGKSTGDYAEATTADFASDALAGVEYLKTLKEINPGEIGLIGHSEGGEIAPMVAAESNDVAFIVLLAGPGLPGDQILLKQEALIAGLEGVPEKTIERDTSFNSKIFSLIKENKNAEQTKEGIKKIVNSYFNSLTEKEKTEAGSSDKLQKEMLKTFISPWMEYFIRYNPVPTLEKVKCPVLALDGSKDVQVPPKEDLAAIKAALEKGGNKNFKVRELPGLNHLFQDAKTGAPSEYGKIEETFSPKALKIIGDWISKIVNRQNY